MDQRDAIVRTVLVVDDEKNVVNFVSEMLGMRGFNVLRACGAREALEQAADFNGTLDLLLADVVMPAMNGRELAGRIARLRPETKVLFMSAYSDEIVTSHGVVPAGVDLIRKPFRLEDLVKRIDEVMSRSKRWVDLPNSATRMTRS